MNDKSGTEAVLTDEEKNHLDEGWSLTSDVAYCRGGEGEAAEQEKDARYRALVEAEVLVHCPDGQTFAQVYHYPDRKCSWCEDSLMWEHGDIEESPVSTEEIRENALGYVARIRTNLDHIDVDLQTGDRDLLSCILSNLLYAEMHTHDYTGC